MIKKIKQPTKEDLISGWEFDLKTLELISEEACVSIGSAKDVVRWLCDNGYLLQEDK